MTTAWVSIGRDGYANLKFPRDRRVIKKLKKRIPVDSRWWDQDAHPWVIAPLWVETAGELLGEFFDVIEIEEVGCTPDRHLTAPVGGSSLNRGIADGALT